LYYLLLTVYIFACIVLILFVLLQPGKSDASAVFGGGANSAAFGPRGTQTVLAKITITAAVVFFLTAFLFSIPGLFDRRSAGESIPAESAPSAPVTPSETPAPPAATEPGTQPAASPEPNSNSSAPSGAGNSGQNTNSSAKPEDKKPGTK
jgi:preprotein translocase subunit SecG